MSYLVNLAVVEPNELIAFAPFVLAGVIVAFFVAKSLVEIISNARTKREMLRFHHEQALAAYEKGLPPPPLPAEVLKDLNSAKGKRHKSAGNLHGNLFWGVVLLIVAAGFIYFDEGFEHVGRAVPIIVLFALGVGNLLLFFVRRKRADKKEEDEKESKEEGI